MDVLIGICSYIGGFVSMFAVHMIMTDIYEQRHNEYVRKLRNENKALRAQETKIEVEHVHTFATPDDVTDLQFLED